jgi:hypothetical protein
MNPIYTSRAVISAVLVCQRAEIGQARLARGRRTDARPARRRLDPPPRSLYGKAWNEATIESSVAFVTPAANMVGVSARSPTNSILPGTATKYATE